MFEFLNFNYITTHLKMIWIFAGFVCFIPLFWRKTWHKYLIVFIVFAAIYISFDTNKDFIGKPYYGEPEGKWVYLTHRIDTLTKQKYITLWVLIKGDDKLYRFEYTKERNTKLREAREKTKRGMRQIGEFRKKEQKGNKNRFESGVELDLKIYDFPYQEAMPK